MSSPVDENTAPFFGTTFPDAVNDTTDLKTAAIDTRNAAPPWKEDNAKGKKRVGFSPKEDIRRIDLCDEDEPSESHYNDTQSPPTLHDAHASPPESGYNTPNDYRYEATIDPILSDDPSRAHLPQLDRQVTEELREALQNLPKPRPAIRRGGSRRGSTIDEGDFDPNTPRAKSARHAYEKAKGLEKEAHLDFPTSGSRDGSPRQDRNSTRSAEEALLNDNAPEDDSEDEHGHTLERSRSEAQHLIRRHTLARGDDDEEVDQPDLRSGYATPTEGVDDYIPRPKQYRGGILGSILSLYGPSSRYYSGEQSACSTPATSPPSSGTNTPTGKRQFPYSHKRGGTSTSSLATLVGTSSALASPSSAALGEVNRKLLEQNQTKRPGLGKRTRSEALGAVKRLSRSRAHEEIKIKNHVEETINRQKYLVRLCRALMQYGAPTHRLEEYMVMSARVLETDAQFLYLPGAMIVSFEDRDTHTSEVRLVKEPHNLDLGKLRDAHEIYKEVIHDRIGVNAAIGRLKELSKKEPKHSRLYRIPVYGLAAVCVGPFAFGARFIDLPIAFVLGCLLGFLQLFAAPKSTLHANVFEIVAAISTSFLARMFGSIRNGELFCFSALAQSSIALILPGYTVLCAALELQSRSIIAGSVRMVYAIIYSLFLGYGITIGTATYGIFDKNATSATTCTDSIPSYWSFLFVPGFTMCLIIINQAKWKQAPVMLVIALVGYIVNFYSAKRFKGNTQVSNTLGALAIGVMANLYSRLGPKIANRWLDLLENKILPAWTLFRRKTFSHEDHKHSPKSAEEGISNTGGVKSTVKKAARRVGFGLAATAMLPAIFVQVPSGLSVNGSLVSGIASANQITGNDTSGSGTTVVDITTLGNAAEGLNSIAFTVGFSVVQIAIGITVGLSAAAIIVYPGGKKRSGVLSF